MLESLSEHSKLYYIYLFIASRVVFKRMFNLQLKFLFISKVSLIAFQTITKIYSKLDVKRKRVMVGLSTAGKIGSI